MNRTPGLLIGLVLLGCDPGPTELDSGSLEVQGQVVLDGRPLAGASIEVARVYSEKVYDTSIQGYHYETRRILVGRGSTGSPDGTYRVDVQDSPDCSNRGEVRVEWNSAWMERGLESACGRYEEVHFRLVTDTIQGRVTLDGASQEGIVVTLHERWCKFICTVSDPLASATTDADGTFELLLVACRTGPQYLILADIAVDVEASHFFEGCPPPTQIELQAVGSEGP